MEKILPKVAVVGAGYWGKNLIRNFYGLGALAAICDINEKLLEDYKSKYPEISTTTDFDSVLNNPTIHAIVISTPATIHYELTKKALLADRDVFVEKPLALRSREGKELLELAKEKNRILMVDHLLHYHPAIEKLKELVAQGELGEIQYIYSNRLNLGRIRREENVLWSFAPHDISLILSLTGKLPAEVSVHGGHYLQKAVADVTLTHLHFENGKRCHIFVSWLHPYKDQKLIVVGTKKMAVFDDVSDQKLVLYPHKVEVQADTIPLVEEAKAEPVPIEMIEPLRKACSHFLECIQERKQPLTDGEEGLKVLKVLQSCQESLENGGQHVYLV
jgi:UDP-2-acetamido-3-amino-2,3-dideoxy-glucuronate N-acetyltransferase